MNPFSRMALTAILASTALFAAPVGAIKGYVKDASGAVIPNCAIELRNLTTNTTTKSTSDASGFYQFLQLNPATYEISAEATGFRKKNIKGVTVLVDQIVSIDVTLDLGQVTEVVEVSGAAALIETEKSSTGSNMDPKMMGGLPLANRRFNDLAILTPGVSFSASGTQAGGFAAAGSRAQSTNWMIDGVNALDPQVNGPLNSFRIADAVQEFSVITTAPSAEFGRQSGAQVNVVTKSGTNQFHGSAFWFVRNDKLQAADFFTNKLGGKKNPLRRNQYGATLGGPIRKDKTFFFYSWEGLKERNPLPTTAVVPTAAQRASVVDPIARKLLDYYPLPTVPGAAAGTTNYVANVPRLTNDNTHLVRIDHNFSTSNRLSGRYIWYGGTVVAAGGLPNTGGNTNTPGSQSLSITDTHTFSPTFFSELRLGFSRNKTDFKVQDVGSNPASILAGVPGVVDTSKDGDINSGIPRVQITGYASLGSATNLPQGRITNTYELFLNNTKVAPFGWSKHTLKFGYYGRREEARRFLNGNSRGFVQFSSFDNFAGICATCGGRSLLQSSQIRTGDTLGHWYRYPHAFYFQDDIKLRPNLTINIGLRYELPEVSIEKQNRGTNFIEGVGPVLIGTNQLLDLDVTKRGRDSFIYKQAPFTLPRAGVDPDRNNFGPVFGFAYTPIQKTVIRGGFRVSYDEVFNNIPVNQTLNVPWVLTTEQRAGVTQPAAGYAWDLAFNQNIPLVARTTQAPGAPAVGLISFNGIDPKARTTYAYNWNFGVQRELSRTMSIDVSYIGSAGHKLGVFVDLNEPRVVVRDPSKSGPTAPNEQFFPFPQWGTLRGSVGYQLGNSIYNGLVLTHKVRMSGFTMQTSYTWSHSLDNSSAFFGSNDDFGYPLTRTRLDLERSNSANDQRHRFVNFLVYDLPFFRSSHGIVRQVASGWSVSGITNIATGNPFTVFSNTATDLSGYNQLADRPDIVGTGALSLDRGNPDNFFDPAYFGKTATACRSGCAPAGRPGTSARNGFYGPGLVAFDMTASKSFPIRERLRLEYRADFFNLFNHTNFALVAGNRSMSSGQFGQLSSSSTFNGGNTGGPRVIQMTLRLQF